VTVGGASAACRYAVNCYLRPFEPWRIVTDYDPLNEQRGAGGDPTVLPQGFRQEVVAAGFDVPVAFDVLPDGRIVVGEKAGVVRLVDGDRVSTLLDIRDRVNDWSLRGLVALRAAPDFAESGTLYVFYVHGSDGSGPRTMRLSRFRAAGAAADPASETVVLGAEARGDGCREGDDCIPAERVHNGGSIEFEEGGAILLSTGDAWTGDRRDPITLRAQDLDWLAGKLLRVTGDGEGLTDNPFFDGDASSNRSRVFAYGLRNPYRFALGADGRPVVADVGWNDWDEVNVVERGDNLGWPCYEGRERVRAYAGRAVCRDLFTRGERAVRMPVLTRPASSITGGAFLPVNASVPARYRGAYVFGDWLDSSLHSVPAAAIGGSGPAEAEPFGAPAGGPSQISLAPDGTLLYLALNVGELRRIVPGG
jgi:glucose/arabinose dehydrogenase